MADIDNHPLVMWFFGFDRVLPSVCTGYANIATPLMSLLQKDKFCWTLEAQQAFKNLKCAMTKAHVLALPNFEEQFVIETNVSGQGIGVVLMQQRHPIAYFSKKLSPRMQCASAYARELCVVTKAMVRWRQYLLG